MDAQNVLVVEDDVALSTLVVELLTHAGYRPIAIADHAHIARAVDRWDPRCVILDGEIRTTGESRTWADAAAIRRAHPTLPVVIFTADSAAVAEVRAGRSKRSRAAAFAGIVAKPFVVEEFLATVRAAVGGPPVSVALPAPAAEGAQLPVTVFPDVGRLAADWPETDLFSTIVHELRGPLTVIRGQVQLARQQVGRDPERELQAMDRAIAQVDRMSQLISELLDNARLESKGLSLTIVVFDLAAVLERSIALHEFGTGPRITFTHPDGAVPVHGDPGRVVQIVDNLLSNALKYSAPDLPIGVALTVRDETIEVRVSDHGVGIPDAEQSRLFTPFFRASTTGDVRGTGLGLHISRQLAERHGGRLWLESSSPAGSVFVLALPLARRDA